VIDRGSQPPRLARWLAHSALRDERWRDVTLGDLGEEFALLSASSGGPGARAWYWRQAIAIVVAAFAAGISAFLRSPGDGFMTTWFHDARIAARSLRQRPLIALIVLVTLALGLGANAATFNMVDALILRPFPIPDVDRLVVISENSQADPYPKETVSNAAFLDFQRDATAFTRMAALGWWDVNMAGADRPERVLGHRVTPQFFSMLGGSAQAGRLLQDSDLVAGNDKQIVISDGLWHRSFGGRRDIVGSQLLIDGVPHQIVGIASPGFAYPDGTELWGPLAFSQEGAADRTDHYLTVVAELPPGGTLDAAQSQLAALYERQRAISVDGTRGRQVIARPFSAAMIDIGMPQILWLWQAAAVFVLLIACTNVASLLIARAAERQHELAVRLAIGAGRAQIVRQLLIESLVMALAAVPLALGVAFAAVQSMKSAMPPQLVKFVAGWTHLGIDTRVVLFTIAAAVVTSIIFGLLPAVQASRTQLTSAITDGSRSMSAGRARTRLRRGLVIAEIALALPLLVVSALSAVGAQRFASGPQGYEPEGVIRFRLRLPEAQYQEPAAQAKYVERLIEVASAVPGVERLGTSTIIPALSSNSSRRIAIDGVAENPDAPIVASFRSISPNYLETLRIPVTTGRTITTGDLADTQRVALVSESFARQYLSDGAPLGRRIRIGTDDKNWATVVGITGDVIDDWFANRHSPTVYVPVSQIPSTSVTLVVRAKGDATALTDPLRAAIASVDRSVPPYQVMTMADALHERTTGLRFIASLMAAFGIVALVLAAFGIYGVMSHFVVARRHEMGVRMALGATSSQILGLTLKQAGWLTGIGLLLGLGIAIGLARLMESALFGVVALQPSLVATITLTLAVVGFLASVLPARHAARVNAAGLLRR
jgi:predicted permease